MTRRTPCRQCGALIDQPPGNGRYDFKHCADCRARNDARNYARRKADPIRVGVRRAVVARDGMTCRHCGCAVRERAERRDTAADTMELDHLRPLSRGGRSTVENLAVSCFACNRRRYNRAPITLDLDLADPFVASAWGELVS